MDNALIAFVASATMVTLAEMGDKTQLLAMAFATRYKASQVLFGVFIATVLNHALAVAVGTYLGNFSGFKAWMQIISAVAFIGFGLWTLKGDKLDGEADRVSRFGPIMTVAIAFFLAEMGDKTQLATVLIASEHSSYPVFVLIGTTTGMLIADAIGIIVGVVMCKRIPERIVKVFAAVVFILFGLYGIYNFLSTWIGLTWQMTAGITSAVAIAVFGVVWAMTRKGIKTEENNDVAEYCKVKNVKKPSK